MKEAEQDRLLKSSTQWQRKLRRTEHRIGDEAATFLKNHQRQFNKNAALADVWNEVLPAGMRPYCRLDHYRGTTLTVQAAPGPYMHQLQLMQQELIAELTRRCPGCGVRKLQIVPLRDITEESTE